jgi:hypothetical protein
MLTTLIKTTTILTHYVIIGRFDRKDEKDVIRKKASGNKINSDRLERTFKQKLLQCVNEYQQRTLGV